MRRAFSFEVDDYAAGKIISVGGVEPGLALPLVQASD